MLSCRVKSHCVNEKRKKKIDQTVSAERVCSLDNTKKKNLKLKENRKFRSKFPFAVYSLF